MAQDDNEVIGFENVSLWIYPEYDDPRLLVMLEGQIVGAPAPAKVRFLVPSAAEMYSAGSIDAQEGYSGGPPDREASSIPGWDEISYEVTTDTFRVEYYDSIIRGQSDKTISYEFRWLYPISDLEVIVQEPRRSSNFSVSPEGDSLTDYEGFTLHLYHYQDIDDEPPLRFDIAYTKSDTKSSLAIEGNGDTNLLLVVGIVIVLGGAFVAVFLGVRKSRPKTRAERRAAAKAASGRTSKDKRSARKFCSQCGERLEEPSQFCPYCGAKL